MLFYKILISKKNKKIIFCTLKNHTLKFKKSHTSRARVRTCVQKVILVARVCVHLLAYSCSHIPYNMQKYNKMHLILYKRHSCTLSSAQQLSFARSSLCILCIILCNSANISALLCMVQCVPAPYLLFYFILIFLVYSVVCCYLLLKSILRHFVY